MVIRTVRRPGAYVLMLALAAFGLGLGPSWSIRICLGWVQAEEPAKDAKPVPEAKTGGPSEPAASTSNDNGSPKPPTNPPSEKPATAPEASSSKPSSGGSAESSAPSSDDRRKVDEILNRLEERSIGLRNIRCAVRYRENDQLNLVQREKTGRILFEMAHPNPRFLIFFERTSVDGQVGKREWYLFDGRYLFQTLERLRQVEQNEIAEEGKAIDMFDLEKSPFPLPFGQSKAKIEKNFDVTLAAPKKDDPADTDHLVCIPKPGTRMAKQFDKVEFFVMRSIHLPQRIVATKNSGLEVDTADFPDLRIESLNVEIEAKDFSEPAEWKDYSRIIEHQHGADEGKQK